MASRLDTAANVATILLCCIGAAMLFMRLQEARTAPMSQTPPAPYKTGEAIAGAVGAVDFTKATGTVVLFLRSTCHYCTESMPFYRRLVEAAHAKGSKVKLAAVSFEAVSVTRKYLEQHQVGIDDVHTLSTGSTRLNGTPTLLLLDRRGIVQMTMIGKLPPDREDAVLAKIGAM
jgi:hypothetical protein